MYSYTSTRPVATNSDGRAAELTPADLDPDTYPIIAQHWFGVANPRRQRAAEHLHNLGPRPVLEALAEVEAGADLDRVLADFARLDLETVRQIGGDHFPPAPIYEVS